MAATITPLLTKFTGATSTTSDCEAVTDWSGTPVLDTINNLENLGCLSKKVSNTALSFVYTLASPFNFTAAGHTHIYVWMLVTTVGKLALKANGGMRIRVEGATTADFKEWYVGGKDTYSGGWKNFVIDTTKTPDASGGTVTMSAVPKVGVAFLMGVSVTGNVTNCFWDVMRQGSGLQITGATSGTPGTFQDILDAEAVSTNFYGILRKEGGVLFCSGELIFGDSAGTSNTYFTDTGQVLVFEDKQVNSALYKIKTQGNATGTTQIKFGTKIGTGETAVGNAGITFRSANKSSTPFQIDCLQSNVGIWGFYGCTFQNGGVTKFDKISTNTAELISCSWNNMDQAQVAGSFVRNCTFSGYTPDIIGALLWNASIDIKKCAFNANTDATNNPAAIEHPAQGTFTYTDLTFSGNDYDINYTAAASSGVLTIQTSGTSNPTTSKILNATGNSVSIQTSADLIINIVDADGNAVTASSANFTADAGTEIITSAGHGLSNGNLIFVTSTVTLPGGLSANTNYFVINKTTNTFQVSLVSGGSAVDITSTGSGTHTWISGGDCEVTIVRNSDTSVLYNAENVTTGTTTYSYTSGGGTVTYINVHNATRYQNKLVNNYTLPSSGTTTLTIQLDSDPFYTNP